MPKHCFYNYRQQKAATVPQFCMFVVCLAIEAPVGT